MTPVNVDDVRGELRRASAARSAAALVATPDAVAEVSVAPEGRWVVRSHSLEWVGCPGRVECWEVLSAGARPLVHNRPSDWIHPAVGILWPELLPIWGRVGDTHAPDRVIVGAHGPGQIVLATTGSPSEPVADAVVEIDPQRWLCLRVVLPGKAWTLQEYRVTVP